MQHLYKPQEVFCLLSGSLLRKQLTVYVVSNSQCIIKIFLWGRIFAPQEKWLSPFFKMSFSGCVSGFGCEELNEVMTLVNKDRGY
jgi:hypothetical protein